MYVFKDIRTRNELADFLNISRKQLSYALYIKGVNNFYTSFEISKKNGSVRKINAPSGSLKDIQKKLADALYKDRVKNFEEKNNVSHAFEKSKSIITNAKTHRNKRFVLNIDIEDFFESIHFGRVRGYFNKNKNFLLPLEVATVIAQISCYNGKLPQGSPSSPIISNLICEILDYRIMKVAKKFKMNYTRYADDLTFSTNDKNFLDFQTDFYQNIHNELLKAGFNINEEKVRLQFNDSRQEVTGLVVNDKMNVKREYYKKTRAMANKLYKEGRFEIDGESGTFNQLEGRFAFINQLTWYNNKRDEKKSNVFNLNSSKEKEYQKFLFYKHFFANPNPLIVTEGKTDIVYLKSALKNLHDEYPNLITKNDDGSFEFKVSFLKKTNKLSHFLGVYQDGGNAMKNIYNFFAPSTNYNFPDYLNYFKRKSNNSPYNPVFLMFDNEINSGKNKPIKDFLNHSKLSDTKKSVLEDENIIDIIGNLYLLTVPLINDKNESDIEDLFDDLTLSKEINGKTFSKRDRTNKTKHYGKEIFSKYILNNYKDIDFSNFRPVLDNIDYTIQEYKNQQYDGISQEQYI